MGKLIKSTGGLIAGAAVLALISMVGVAAYQMRASANAANELTLDPNQFLGETRQAYVVAQKHPDLLAQLHCYCGCEQHEGHHSLFDCFRTNHGAACAVCVAEAVAAGEYAEGGMPADQIREALHQRYGNGG